MFVSVVIWASVGILINKDHENGASSTKALVKAILGIASIFLALRILFVTLRQLKKPLGRSGISQITNKSDF